jgi:hypothetical protein
MRRTLTALALLCIAACWTGCSSSGTNSVNSNVEGSKSTGAYNSSPSGPSPASNTSSTTTTTSAPPPGGGKTTGIKPPMKNENQK